jgi:hypothetical protein
VGARLPESTRVTFRLEDEQGRVAVAHDSVFLAPKR